MKLWDFVMLKLKTSFETLKAEYEAHNADDNAHNVARFIEKDVINIVSNDEPTTLKQTVVSDDHTVRNMNFKIKTEDLSKSYFTGSVQHYLNYSEHGSMDGDEIIGKIFLYKNGLSNKSFYRFTVRSNTELKNVLELHDDRIDFMNRALKDPFNLAASALSGTPKVVVIMIGSTPYYFGVYPVKA